MSVHSRILRLVVVEANSFSLSARKDRATMTKNLGFNSIQGHLLFRSDLGKSRNELLIVDLAGGSLFVPSKYEVDVGSAALLVRQPTLLCQLSKRFAVHFSAISIGTKDLLEA